VALCPDVASLIVIQFDCCNLFWRSVILYRTGKTSYWPVLNLRVSQFSFGTKTVAVNCVASSDRQLVVQTLPRSPSLVGRNIPSSWGRAYDAVFRCFLMTTVLRHDARLAGRL
jgi:hypothetical protein